MADYSHLRNILADLFTSGKFKKKAAKSKNGSKTKFYYDVAETDEKFRYVIFNSIFFIGGIFFLFYGLTVFLGGREIRSILDLTFFIICILGIIMLRTKIKFFYIGLFSISAFTALCAYFVFSGDASGFSSLWIYIVPPLSIFILGLKTGIIISSSLLIITAVVIFIPAIPSYSWLFYIAFRIIYVYILELFLNIAYEIIRISKVGKEKELQNALKRERDEISAMKDNLRNGIFLMDKNYIIQDNYSPRLEAILGYNNLAGEMFTNFLTSSITSKESEILIDYFDMVREKKFDSDMLEDINPIRKFQYINPNNNESCTLQTSFISIEQEDFIMGNILDITEETALQNNLKKEEEKSHGEMRSLFEVIQIESTVFNDFIEDTEYEFEKINSQLKDKSVSAIETLNGIFQSVHAIKANAIILDLKTFSTKAHEIETTIKELRGKGEVTFNDMLSLTINIESLMKDKDKFVETVAKIKSFNNTQSKKNNTDVLIDSLNRACERTSSDMGKTVTLVIKEIEQTALDRCPRRAVKEALLQLLRNSVVHGIETPEKRAETGKNPKGTITLSIKKENNLIHIRLQDDGTGFNFEKIKKRAIEMHIIQKEEASKIEHSKLLQAIFAPGFSTAEKESMHAGRGIGLNLVRDRIKEIGGAIKIQTEQGKGTAFNIFLPIETNTKKENKNE
ncbi:hypothetical protein FACS189494_07380 [Spirochaetia bacterium]|nr:hypothetical protein FACS189494_07380 [Spirochaetia bacterium]